MRPSTLTAVIIAMLLITPANGQTLWQNTIVGMTEADLAKLYPDTKLVKTDGKERLVKTDPIQLFGTPFSLSFHFDNGKLFQVYMQSMQYGSNNNTNNLLVTYMQITDELIRRYGKPTEIHKSSIYGGEKQYFLSEGISIKLEYSNFSSIEAVSIEYSSSIGGDTPL